jgi:hypothetical protein
MATLLNRLFPSRTRTARRAAKGRTPAKTRLGVETLDARVMPSVTSVLNSSSGVLTITADAQFTNAAAIKAGGAIGVIDFQSSYTKYYPQSAVTGIVYNGGLDGTTYYFHDVTDLPTTFNAGPGSGRIYGGSGANTFNAYALSHSEIYGGSGANTFNAYALNNATLFAGTGTNLLNRYGAPAVLKDVAGVTSGPKLTFGLISGTPTPDQLAATGNLAASLSGNAVTINGPSGIGFQLLGHWIDRIAPNGSHTFTAYDGVTLHTGSALGDIPVMTGVPVTVTTQGLGLGADGGEFASISWAGNPLNGANTTSLFSQLGSQYGLSVSGGGTSWGIKLGGDLSLGVPLNPGVPYLYYESATGGGVSFGSINANASNSQSFSVAVDPADPSVTLKFGDYGFGASLKGEIPYTPTTLPDGVADPKIYGNVYATGTVALGEVPATVTGNVVIDLNANNGGTPCGLTPQTLGDLLHGKTNLSSALGATADNFKVGLNGEIDFSTEKYGLALTAKVGHASAFYTPDSASGPALLAFAGQSDDPLAGTGLEKLTALEKQISPDNTFDVQGKVDGNYQWSIKGEAVLPGTFCGFREAALEFDADSATHTAHANATFFGLLGVGVIDVSGKVDWDTGDFDLAQTASFSLDAKVCSFNMSEGVDLSYHHGVVAMNVALKGSGTIGWADDNVHASFSGDLTVSEDNAGKVTYHVAGSASATVGYTFAGTAHDHTLADFDFDNEGFSIDFYGHHAHANW